MQHPAHKAWPIVLLFFGLSFQAAAVDHCEPSKWGADDEIGAANYVNPQQIWRRPAWLSSVKATASVS